MDFEKEKFDLSVEAVDDDEHEVFRKSALADAVDYRTVGWPRATVIYLKIIFALGVLSIPSCLYDLGAVGGSFVVIGFGALNTYCAYIQGAFRANHRECHTVVDMAFLIGGPITREIVSIAYLWSYVLVAGAGLIGVSIGLNALSTHASCTVVWTIVAAVVTAAFASLRKFEEIGWLTWFGFGSIFTAVFSIVIAVTTHSRPASAPQQGPYELGFYAVASPTFVVAMTATSTIFVSSAATSAFIPVIAEMRRPRDYNKALYTCMGFVTACYLTFSLVVYAYCGKWVASPALGSAGKTMKMVSYGIAIPGLFVSAILYIHVAAKYLFVRILRGSRHLQSNTVIHWGTWLGSTFGLTILAFVVAEAIPFFGYLLGLTGAFFFAPLGIILPIFLWFYDNPGARKGDLKSKSAWAFHVVIALLGLFIMVGGTYASIMSIKDAYQQKIVGSAFACADNSGST